MITDGALLYPNLFFPAAGVCLAIVAAANFSTDANIVLGAQAYVAAFHTGAVFTHLRVKHHPAAAAAPGIPGRRVEAHCRGRRPWSGHRLVAGVLH